MPLMNHSYYRRYTVAVKLCSPCSRPICYTGCHCDDALDMNNFHNDHTCFWCSCDGCQRCLAIAPPLFAKRKTCFATTVFADSKLVVLNHFIFVGLRRGGGGGDG